MKYITKDMIEDVVTLCPYCMSPVSIEATGCCGEASTHFEDAYEIEGEYYLKSEIEVVENEKKETND
jgi:hypothetical protein